MGKIYFPQFKNGKDGFEIHPGSTILDYAQKLKIKINAECGGIGKCGKCIVRIEKGKENLNSKTSSEKKFNLSEEYRLACQTKIVRNVSDVVVYIKDFGEYEILKSGLEKKVEIYPLFKTKNGKVYKNEVEIENYKGGIYGIALDIGTTTIVFNIVNLENGDIVGTIARTNPQIVYGNDVISRIEYTMIDKKEKRFLKEEERREKLVELQRSVVDLINEELRKFNSDILDKIYEIVVAGNSAMRNIFFLIDISTLGKIPYEPLNPESIVKKPEEIGLQINKNGEIYGLPLIGGHVGADVVADILASEIYKEEKVCMLIDIGTNGEIVIGNKDKILATSAAAGGAFEGVNISCGVGGIEGAIKEVKIINGKVYYSTIGDKYPIGICGSGLIDLLSEMLKNGIINEKARLKNGEFYITDDIKITQQDIFQLIISKSAIRTSWQILSKIYPIDIKNIDKIFIAGGFGNFINIENAMKIGLLPEVDKNKVIKIGNGSLEGAREVLLCYEKRKIVEEIVQKVEHIRTNEIEPNFNFLLAENMYF
ncbi:MAG: ASKHA domain-containing protein [Candidatus Omnitrophica bacterium]|nr:ASKHA domain-containing protein [Candidatus Omnitrophota bacterium]MCM8806943.1 ASKHA domain-containing protein [Candidatus Omnitrophota bacterium]